MNILTFNFCEVDAVTDLDIIVNDIKKPVTPTITENIQDVPGMVGKVFLGNSYGQKIFDILITIKANNSTERTKKVNELTDLVMTFGSGEYPMIFSNDPGNTFYGHFTNITTPERISPTSSWATCTLTFACSDPKGYGNYKQQDMMTNPITITPEGTGECYPIFTCLPKKDVTKIAVTDEDGTYVYVGSEVDPDTGETPVDKEPLVLHDVCNTLATWTLVTQSNLTWTLDNGVISGNMGTTPSALRVGTDSNGYADYGPAVEGKWHGPCRLQWLPSSYNDYRVKIGISNYQYYARSRAKSEIYLVDSNGLKIGYISIKDKGNSEEVMVKVRLFKGASERALYDSYGKIKNGKRKFKTVKLGTGTKKIKEKGKTKTVQQWRTVKLDEDTSTSTYTDFYGYVTLEKIGNKFKVEIMKLNSDNNPAWSKPITVKWTDSNNTYSQDLAGIAFYTAKYDIDEDRANPIQRYRNNGTALYDVKVWNILDGGNGGVGASPVVIARKGEEVKLNCEDRTIYKNGDIFMKNLFIGSQFPIMEGGALKSFAFEPDLKDADWYLEYRPTTS